MHNTQSYCSAASLRCSIHNFCTLSQNVCRLLIVAVLIIVPSNSFAQKPATPETKFISLIRQIALVEGSDPESAVSSMRKVIETNLTTSRVVIYDPQEAVCGKSNYMYSSYKITLLSGVGVFPQLLNARPNGKIDKSRQDIYYEVDVQPFVCDSSTSTLHMGVFTNIFMSNIINAVCILPGDLSANFGPLVDIRDEIPILDGPPPSEAPRHFVRKIGGFSMTVEFVRAFSP